MRTRWLLLLALFLIPLRAYPQGVRVGDNPQVTSSPVSGGQLFAVANANISFCSHPANAVPCTNKVTTYTDITLGTPCSTSTQIVLAGTNTCVANSDGLGNWGIWVAAGTYDYTIQLPGGGAIGPYTVTLAGAGGGFTAGLDLAGTSLSQQVIGLHFGVNAIQLATSLQTGCVQITGTAINGTGQPCITSTISTPAGSDTQLQFNKSSVMGATSGLGVNSSTSPTSLQIPFNEAVSGPRPRRDVTSPVYAGGADPTATVDSTAAIQAAINAACAAGGLGDVYFPPGNYKIAASTTSAPQLSIPRSCQALHLVGGNGAISPDKAQFQTPPQAVLYSPNCTGAGTGPMFLLEAGSLANATQGGTGSTFSNLGIVGCNQGVWAYGVANVTFNNIAFGNTNSFGADSYSLKISNSFFVYINGGTINNYNTTIAGVLLSGETPLGTEPSEAQIINFRNTIFNGAVLFDQRVSTPNQSGAILFDGVQAEIGGSSVPFFTTQCEASCNAFGPLNISYSGVSDNNSGTPLVQLRGFARYNDVTIIDSNGSATGSPAINADHVLLDCMVIGGAFSSRTVVDASGNAQSGCVQQNINGFDFTSAASSFPSGVQWTTGFLTQGGFFGGNQGPAIRMALPGDTQSRLALDPNAGLIYGPGGSGAGGWDTQFYRSGAGALSMSLGSAPNTFPGSPQFTFNQTGLGILLASPSQPLDMLGNAEILGGINFYADTGAANAYVITANSALASLSAGETFTFQATHANTGTSTLNINGIGAKTIKKNGGTGGSVGSNLASGDIAAGQVVTVAYDGTNFQMQSTLGNAGGGGGSGTVGNCANAPAAAYYSGTGTTITCLNLPAFMQYLYAADSGVSNAYVVAPPTAATLVTGTTINFTTTNPNTAASTINVSSLGVKNLTKFGVRPLVAGDILANTYYVIQYDGIEWQVLNPSGPCINCMVTNAPNIMGTPGTIDLSGSTVANAFKIPIVSAGVTSTNGAVVLDSTFQNVHLGANSVDNLFPLLPASVSITDADCAQFHNVSSHITLNDAGNGGCTLLNANNVFGVNARVNLAAATSTNSFVLPNQAGAAPSIAGSAAFDTTNLQPVISDGVIVCPYSKEQVNTQSGAGYTVLTTDCGKLVSVSNAGAQTLTLPATPPSKGWYIDAENTGSGTWTISPNGNNLDGAAGSTTIATNQGMRIVSNGASYFTQRGVGGGSGGSANINPSAQFSVPYYANAGTSNVLSGQQAPSSPNGVPQFEVSIPSGGSPTAPTFAPAGVVPRTVSGTSDTIVATDRAGEVIYTSGSAVAVTLPQAGTAGFASNFVTLLSYTGQNILTITPTTSTINGSATLTMGVGDFCFIYSDNTNYTANCGDGYAQTIAADTGSANAYAVAFPLIQTLAKGSGVFFTVGNANTTASTLAVNGLTTKNLTKAGNASLIANDLITGKIYWAVYDGTQWELMNPSNGELTTFTAHKWLGNGSASTAVATATTIGSSDTSPNWYAADSGAANAYVVAPIPAITALTTGVQVNFSTTNANSGASTINVSGLGVKALDKLNAIALVSGDILSGAIYSAVYDGTEWILLDPSVGSGSGTVANCTTAHSVALYNATGTTVSCFSESNATQYLYAADSGAANAYVITLAPALTSLVTGEQAFFTTTHPNTTASTINVNALGVKNITKNGTNALISGDILASTVYEIIWDGTEWQLINPSTLGAAVATSLLATGIIDGTVPVTISTSASVTLGGTYNSGYTFNNDVTSGAAITFTLPTAAAGKQYCVSNGNGGSADIGVLTLQTSAAGQFILFTDGTYTASGGFVSSGGAARDGACVVGADSTHWVLYVQSGTWAKH